MKKNILFLSAAAALIVFVVFFLYQNNEQLVDSDVVRTEQTSSEEQVKVHYHAAFHHYKDGELQDYSDFRYMSVTPCSLEEDHEHTDVLDQVHLHDGNGEVVHVHADGITWRHLFTSLGIDIHTTNVYIDGELVDNGLDSMHMHVQRRSWGSRTPISEQKR